MKLYHHPFSSNARRALMIAKRLDLAVELELVDLPTGAQHKPEFLALNPNGAVPVLVDGDLVLTESNAIMIYFCEKAGEAGRALYPADAQGRAHVNRWLFWTASHLGPAIAGLNFENNLKKMFGQGEADPAQVARHEGFFKKFAGVLDGELAKREWVASNALSLADFCVAAPLMYAGAAKLPLAGLEHLARWFDRVQALPEWKATSPGW